MITRRVFVQSLAATALSAPLWGGCQKVVSKGFVLERLALDVLAPDVRALPRASEQLRVAVQALVRDAARLEVARSAWRDALLAWQRCHAFRIGPVVESNALMRGTFWPTRESALARALGHGDGIDDALVESLGVDAKGLFALEHLLFTSDALSGAAAQLAPALARDLLRRAQAARAALGDGKPLVASLTRDPQESLQHIVNMLIETSESAAADRLERVRGLSEHDRLLPALIQGGYSGSSAAILRVWLETMQRVYLGRAEDGLCALVKQTAPQADARLRSAFADAVAYVSALSGSLEQCAKRNPVELASASQRAKQLEIALKTELTSSLGVTLSIVSGDGD